MSIIGVFDKKWADCLLILLKKSAYKPVIAYLAKKITAAD